MQPIHNDSKKTYGQSLFVAPLSKLSKPTTHKAGANRELSQPKVSVTALPKAGMRNQALNRIQMNSGKFESAMPNLNSMSTSQDNYS
jgi:hypothetical protein